MTGLESIELSSLHMPRSRSEQACRKRLTGAALLKRISELDSLNKSEKAKACGYVKHLKNGTQTAQLGAFINAILEAKGIFLDPESSKSTRGRKRSYRVQVQINGMIMIGGPYTRELGLVPGQQLDIHYTAEGITLITVETEAEDIIA